MKHKFFFLMSIMFMALVMTGCNKDDNDNDNGNDHGRPGRDCYELSISNIGETNVCGIVKKIPENNDQSNENDDQSNYHENIEVGDAVLFPVSCINTKNVKNGDKIFVKIVNYNLYRYNTDWTKIFIGEIVLC